MLQLKHSFQVSWILTRMYSAITTVKDTHAAVTAIIMKKATAAAVTATVKAVADTTDATKSIEKKPVSGEAGFGIFLRLNCDFSCENLAIVFTIFL